MQTVTYIYILMLALADEIFLIGIPFLIVTSVQGDWIFGMAMCKIYLTTTSINQVSISPNSRLFQKARAFCNTTLLIKIKMI